MNVAAKKSERKFLELGLIIRTPIKLVIKELRHTDDVIFDKVLLGLGHGAYIGCLYIIPGYSTYELHNWYVLLLDDVARIPDHYEIVVCADLTREQMHSQNCTGDEFDVYFNEKLIKQVQKHWYCISEHHCLLHKEEHSWYISTNSSLICDKSRKNLFPWLKKGIWKKSAAEDQVWNGWHNGQTHSYIQ